MLISSGKDYRLQFTQDEIQCLPKILSAPRFATYLRAKNGNKSKALALYHWNLKLSSEFIIPLQMCEVSLGNSIVCAIEKTYSRNWPWEISFEIALPNHAQDYNPRNDLKMQQHLPTPGKIVAELRFAFWQKMLTRRHDAAIWNAHFRTAFPHADQSKTIQELRRQGYAMLEEIRKLRNRIAHHEPIFKRNIQEEYDRIKEVIGWTNPTAAAWVDKIQQVTQMINVKP